MRWSGIWRTGWTLDWRGLLDWSGLDGCLDDARNAFVVIVTVMMTLVLMLMVKPEAKGNSHGTLCAT